MRNTLAVTQIHLYLTQTNFIAIVREIGVYNVLYVHSKCKTKTYSNPSVYFPSYGLIYETRNTTP